MVVVLIGNVTLSASPRNAEAETCSDAERAPCLLTASTLVLAASPNTFKPFDDVNEEEQNKVEPKTPNWIFPFVLSLIVLLPKSI